jgi:hypothetical protein
MCLRCQLSRGERNDASGAGDEVRGEAVADGFGDHLDRMVLCVAAGALSGETLLRARDVVIDMRDREIVDDDLTGRELDQR